MLSGFSEGKCFPSSALRLNCDTDTNKERSDTKSDLPRGIGIKRERSPTMENDAAFLARYKARKLRSGALEIDLTDD